MIHDKLKEIRETTGMNKKEFAQYLGMKYTTYNNYETGAREPSSDFLILISTKFDVSVDYILGTQDEKEILHSYELKSFEFEHIKKYRFISTHSPDGASVINTVLNREYSIAEKIKKQKEYIVKSVDAFPQNTAYNADIRLINYYYRLASAGTGQIVFDMPPTDKIEIPDIPEYKKVDYAIGVNGNSMEPEFSNGDILLIEMTEEIDIGEIGIFIVDNESYVKKLGNGELISLNPDYENIQLTENSRCMGKVVGSL